MSRLKVKIYYFARFSVMLLLVCLLIAVIVTMILKVKKNHDDGILRNFSTNALKFIFYEAEQYPEAVNRTLIKEFIFRHNSKELILNQDTYGALKKESIILVVLVDKFSDSLRYLLVSLYQAKGVEDVLIIFSHSYFDVNMNALIGSIDFCRVLQIFYPYSIQLYPHEFPGRGPHDCDENIKQDFAEKSNCTGAFDPDIHGRYRSPLKSQQKLHWWWTANKVFDNLTITANHKGVVIFMEDDLFLMEDFFYITLYLKNIADSLAQCDFISLGAAAITKSFKSTDTNAAELITWDPEEHSSVLAFDSSVWNSIVSHYDIFCLVDDYSWARSLYYLSLNRRDGRRYKVITAEMPRAFKTSCDLMQRVNQVVDLQKHLLSYLYPALIQVLVNIELEDDEFMVVDYADSGGWGDSRDKEICKRFTFNKIRKILVEMKNEFAEYKSEI